MGLFGAFRQPHILVEIGTGVCWSKSHRPNGKAAVSSAGSYFRSCIITHCAGQQPLLNQYTTQTCAMIHASRRSFFLRTYKVYHAIFYDSKNKISKTVNTEQGLSHV